MMLAGLALLSVGFERLLNAYLLRNSTWNGSVPLVIGVVSALGGMALVVTAVLSRSRSR